MVGRGGERLLQGANEMRIFKTATCSALTACLLLCGRAQAAPQVRIQIQVKPVENQQQLIQLMLQNSLRIFQQRLRFYQQAQKEQEKLQQARDQNRYRHRHRHRHRIRAGTAEQKAKAASAAAPAEKGKTESVKGLRKLLRRKRLKGKASLDRKLKSRLRKRTREKKGSRVRARERRRMSKGGHRRGR
jgi:hypothetical protein